jgi:2-(1,2-epoxy-1,2-dihydrophenyl)acetyl-CoA isomerase
MPYKTLSLTVRDAVAVITFRRPEMANALNTQMRAELLHAVQAASRDETARCLVLTGKGRAFCAGQDLTDHGTVDELDIERTLREEYAPLLRAIYDCPLPTIAAVNGAAAGAGANLALAADIVIATESARFVQAFARIGLMPDAGGTYWLPRQIGFARAMGAALFAEPVTARQAEAWGMIWQAVPDAGFAEAWQARARQLADGPTATYARIKQALRESFDNDLAEQLEREAHLQGECGRTFDFREGVIAFLDKRSPAFRGR